MSEDRRCPHSRSSNGKPKLIFNTEEEARAHGEERPDHEGTFPYCCARGEHLHWHLTRNPKADIPGLKRGRFGRRGGNQGHKRGLTRQPRRG